VEDLSHCRWIAAAAADADTAETVTGVQMILTYLLISLNILLECCHCYKWTLHCFASPRGMTMGNLTLLTWLDQVQNDKLKPG